MVVAGFFIALNLNPSPENNLPLTLKNYYKTSVKTPLKTPKSTVRNVFVTYAESRTYKTTF